ncbi:MAG: VWA domain-containing protein [Pseudomonadota bacterium]
MRKFLRECAGNVAVVSALLAVPLLGTAAVAVDYSKAHSLHTKIRNAEDAALLAGVRKTADEFAAGKSKQQAQSEGKAVARDFFRLHMVTSEGFNAEAFRVQITINDGDIVGTSTYEAEMRKPLLSSIIGTDVIDVSASNTVSISLGDFVEMHFLVDVSASLGVGATTSDIQAMARDINCAFACHVPPGNTTWTDTLATARNSGATLRIDVIRQAIQNIVQRAKDENKGGNLRFAIHAFSNSLETIVSPTDDYDQVLADAAGLDLTNKWDQGGTNFAHSLDQAESVIGNSGNGSRNSPKKIAILFTDGVATNVKFTSGQPETADPRFQVYAPFFNGTGDSVWSMQGFDPSECRPFNRRQIELYAVHTEYVIPTVGTDNDDRFATIESQLKQDIASNLKQCAGGDDYYYNTNYPDEIIEAVADIFGKLESSTLKLTH